MVQVSAFEKQRNTSTIRKWSKVLKPGVLIVLFITKSLILKVSKTLLDDAVD